MSRIGAGRARSAPKLFHEENTEDAPPPAVKPWAGILHNGKEIRQRAAETIGPDRFLVIHLDAPLEVCRQRDESGIYEKVDRGEIRNFPGVSATYEPPEKPALRLETDKLTLAECVEQVITLLESREIL